MDKIIRKVLNEIEKNGFEAYLVGGFVRDYLLGIKSYDIDICTNALPKDLHNIFPNYYSNIYGGFNMQVKNYNIDITTYRKEITYNKRKPTEIEYINNLGEDILRRDFTINAICLTKDDKFVDLVGGFDDLNNKVLRMIGDIDKKLKEDPLRILRAIRLSSTLNFTIEDNLYNSIKKNYKLVLELSNERVKNEFNKILINKNFNKGLNILKDTHILDLYNITYDSITYVNDISGMWAQFITNDLIFTKQELLNIMNVKDIINGGIIDNHTLYKYDLYPNIVASSILHIGKKEVLNIQNKMPIKKDSDIQITAEEVLDILNIEPSKKLSIIKKDITNKILDGTLKNRNNDIKNYIIERYKNDKD